MIAEKEKERWGLERGMMKKSGKKEVKAEHTHPIKTFSMLKERSEVCQEMH